MKKLLLLIISIGIIVFFIICPIKATEASLNGIIIWYKNVFPVLFPCIIISNIVLNSGIINKLNDSKLLIVILVVCGLGLGFPVGGKLTTDLYKNKYLNYNQANKIFPFINNVSPSFVASVMMSKCLHMENMIGITFLILYLPSAILAIYYGLKGNCNKPKLKSTAIKTTSRFQINMQIIDAGIISGFETLIKLCGYIVIFSILVQIIKSISCNDALIISVITGFVEVTNGVINISTVSVSNDLKYILCMAFASFGGLSCIAQVKSIMRDTDISLSNYICTKILLTSVTIILSIFVLLCFRNSDISNIYF